MAGLIPGKPQLRVEGTYINGYIYLQVNEQKLHNIHVCRSLKFFSRRCKLQGHATGQNFILCYTMSHQY